MSHFDANFFLLHFYQTILYLAISVWLFYMEDRWAYMIGILASAVWLGLAFATGLLGTALRQLLRLGHGQGLSNLVSFLAAVTAILSVLTIAVGVRRWLQEYAGLGKSLSTFAVSFGIVAVYYLGDDSGDRRQELAQTFIACQRSGAWEFRPGPRIFWVFTLRATNRASWAKTSQKYWRTGR